MRQVRPEIAIACAVAGLAGFADAADRRPNIVYVMTDDQGYGDIAAHGNPVLHTPNLDRMHHESVRLTEFHVSPTCSPTRAALMTGRHEFRSGVTHTLFERERLALSATTLPELLKTAGYSTGIFGKWHLGDEDAYQPGRRGFDRVFIHGGGGIGQSFPGSCGDAPGNRYFDPVIRSDGSFVRTKGYCTDVFFDAALEWIDTRRKSGEPFFCYLAPNAPHAPLDCPPGSDTPYRAKLDAAGVAGPKVREKIAKFYGMIENIDSNMGRLLARLDDWGLAENTLVVFTTDNGTATGAKVFNDGMRAQKVSPYRGGTRVPAYWRWKGHLPQGIDVPDLTAHIDVLPTLCDLADVELPAAVAGKVEGRSFAPLLRGGRIAWPDRPLVTHVGRWDRGKAAESGHRNCRIREGRWSLVNVQNSPDAWELYDVVADPGEKVDVAKAHPDVVARLSAAYDEWWRSVQPDLVNEDLDGPKANPFKTAYERQFATPPAALKRPNIVLFLADVWARANVTQLDDAFGTLMKPPDEIGAAESTLVFFTSDNGPEGQGARGPGRGLAGGLRGRKRSMHEGGHRVPGILRWPAKIASETTSGLPGIGSDFFPTALAAAGVVAIAPPPAAAPGRHGLQKSP